MKARLRVVLIMDIEGDHLSADQVFIRLRAMLPTALGGTVYDMRQPNVGEGSFSNGRIAEISYLEAER